MASYKIDSLLQTATTDVVEENSTKIPQFSFGAS